MNIIIILIIVCCCCLCLLGSSGYYFISKDETKQIDLSKNNNTSIQPKTTFDNAIQGQISTTTSIPTTTPVTVLYPFTSHTFTNANAIGRLGPKLSDIKSAYSSASWAQNNNFLNMTNDNGIQLWTVPTTGNYTIRAVGAAGFYDTGMSNCRGIDIQTTTTLTMGEVIKILVGQKGKWQGKYACPGGGGGGTFVVRDVQTSIIVAGGGGGGGGFCNNYINSDAASSNVGNSGDGTGSGNSPGSGGNNGAGGGSGNGNTDGGAGLTENGGIGALTTLLPRSFINSGIGGQPSSGTAEGGFGGGGSMTAAVGDYPRPGGGGGGGYSGGGGGGADIPIGRGYSGGGGGSYAISTMTINGFNIDHGSVIITLDTAIQGQIPTTPIPSTTPIPTTTLAPALYPFTSHTFTNAGATGRLGPILSQVKSAYSGASWATSYLNMINNDGIQLWTVPVTGNYTIRTVGAGVPYNPNYTDKEMNEYQKGVDVTITTSLIHGEVIMIAVGQIPSLGLYGQSGGAGGTFVVRGSQTPILVAGGGGGRGSNSCKSSSNATSETTGQNGNNGTIYYGYKYGIGGSNGNGAIGGNGATYSGGGGGLYSNGINSVSGFGKGGSGFINGCNGGEANTLDASSPSHGGFGGGGSAAGGGGGGGGGGYSGGGNGSVDDTGLWSSGGGGGSYSITGSFTSSSVNNNGNGSVVVTLIK